MAQSTSKADKPKPARASRAGKDPRRSGGLKLGHRVEDTPPLMLMSMRVKLAQIEAMDDLSRRLMIPRADLIRLGLDMAIAWARERAEKLGVAR